MKNRNRIDLTIIPVNGSDPAIDCTKCPSVCCREGMTLPLSAEEADLLAAAGTELEPVTLSRIERWRRGLGSQAFFTFKSDCGNLVTDNKGNALCGVFEAESPVRPKACGEFVMGGYACATVQLYRQRKGEDEFISE